MKLRSSGSKLDYSVEEPLRNGALGSHFEGDVGEQAGSFLRHGLLHIRRLSWWLVIAILAFAAAGCGAQSIPGVTEMPGPTIIPTQTGNPGSIPASTHSATSFGYTHKRPDGNRYLLGRGGLPEVQPLHIALQGRPKWIAAAPLDDASIWVAVLDDGSVQAFSITGRQVQDQVISPKKLPAGMPPLLMVAAGLSSLVTAQEFNSSIFTTPAVLQPPGDIEFIRPNGDLVVRRSGRSTVLPLDALPDARLLTDEDDRLLLLTDASESYQYGVLGDRIESKSITMVRTRPSVEVIWNARLPDGDVVEGISPIWSDLDGDGSREILVTVSNSNSGARMIVFNDAGEPAAFGPAVGRGSRWRHQLAVAPFGPSGELEIVDVLTPHIGGIVEFYRLENDKLNVVAQVPGFRSHKIGSRNLDMAVAGDFDGDGRVELVIPNQTLDEIGGIRRTPDGAEVAWTLPIDGKVSTNMAAVATGSGGLMLGVGREDGVLLVWPSP